MEPHLLANFGTVQLLRDGAFRSRSVFRMMPEYLLTGEGGFEAGITPVACETEPVHWSISVISGKFASFDVVIIEPGRT